MTISDLLDKNSIIADLQSRDKKGVLEELAESVAATAGAEKKDIVKVLLERERLGSTGIGGGIGIPHGKLAAITKVVVGIGISREGVEFDALDHKPVHIFFLLVTPENSTGNHLRVLAQLSKLLKQKEFKKSLRLGKSAEEIARTIEKYDEEF